MKTEKEIADKYGVPNKTLADYPCITFNDSHIVMDCYIFLIQDGKSIIVDRVFGSEKEANEYQSRHPEVQMIKGPLILLR